MLSQKSLICEDLNISKGYRRVSFFTIVFHADFEFHIYKPN